MILLQTNELVAAVLRVESELGRIKRKRERGRKRERVRKKERERKKEGENMLIHFGDKSLNHPYRKC